MITRLIDALFGSKYPKGYTGRHRARASGTRTRAQTPPQLVRSR